MIVLGACLLVSCARATERETAPCTLTLRAGESLQAAIDRAPTGAVTCLPAGTWTESIRVTKPLSLRGAGPEKTKIRGAQLAQPVIWVGPVAESGAPIVIAGNYRAGVALYHERCVGTGYVFTGRGEGGRNVFRNNYRGDVCPDELSFLLGEGGSLDLRR